MSRCGAGGGPGRSTTRTAIGGLIALAALLAGCGSQAVHEGAGSALPGATAPIAPATPAPSRSASPVAITTPVTSQATTTTTTTPTEAPTTSAPAKLTYVPDVSSSRSLTAAQAALRKAGLRVKVVKQSSTTVPAGQLIGTSPAAFAVITGGDLINVLVSTGPPHISVPDVLGETEASAEHTLTRGGLIVIVVTSPGSAHLGQVIAETPAGGSSALRDSTVTITVGTAVPVVLVPHVIGETEEAAVATASKLGLMLSFQTKTVHRVSRDRVVLAQSLSAGSKVAKGSQLTLTVGVYAPRGSSAG